MRNKTKTLVLRLFSVAEFLCVRNKTKNLVSLLFSVAEEFGLTAVFCLQSFVVVQ